MACKQGIRSTVGRRGEEIAARFLMESGHTVLERNWRAGHLEIDIISLAADGIHFVEVKSRIFPTMADPEENVRAGKRKRLAKAACRWLERNGRTGMECRFDIISIVFRGETYAVRYLPEAFLPMSV